MENLNELFKTKEGRDILRLEAAIDFFKIMQHLDNLDHAEIEAEKDKKEHF